MRSGRPRDDADPYRLGLVSIGMRSNPYGASIAPNPTRIRKTMAMEDPRHGALFGAAWLLAAVAATEDAGVDAMALASPSGPFGLVNLEGPTPRLRPCFHVFRALHEMRSGQRLRTESPAPALHAVATTRNGSVSLIAANLSTTDQVLALPQPAEVRRLDATTSAEAAHDPDWLSNTPFVNSETVSLPPFALAFARMDA